jgi:hypothetical protein
MYSAILGSVAVLCAVLAVLQYRWTGELARAADERLRNSLQSSLYGLSVDFNSQVAAACAGLQPTSAEIAEQGREQAYIRQWKAWRAANPGFRIVREVGPCDTRVEPLGLASS